MQQKEVNLTTWIVAALLAIVHVLRPHQWAYSYEYGLDASLIVFWLSHANIWHLICNLTALFVLRPGIDLAYALIIGIACAPLCCLSPTMGISGVLFAYYGIYHGLGVAGGFVRNTVVCNAILLIVATGLLPHVALLYHLGTYIVGYVASYCYTKRVLRRWTRR
jgi:hypothetical protein